MKQDTVRGGAGRATDATHGPAPKATTVTNRRGSDRASKNRDAGINPAPSPTIQTFFIPGRLPGANDIVSRQRMVYSRLKSECGVTIARCILVAKLKRVGYCRIEFVWHEPNNRRDDDNVMFGQKFILDALRDTKIIKDDRRQFVYSLTHRVLVDKDCPGVWVTLIPLCVEVT